MTIIEECLIDGKTIASAEFAAFDLVRQGSSVAGLTEAITAAKTIPAALTTCKTIGADVTTLEAWALNIPTNPTDLTAMIT